MAAALESPPTEKTAMKTQTIKTQSIKLTKTEAITIAHRALVETIADRPGIWTYLNQRIQATRQKLNKPQRMQTQSA